MQLLLLEIVFFFRILFNTAQQQSSAHLTSNETDGEDEFDDELPPVPHTSVVSDSKSKQAAQSNSVFLFGIGIAIVAVGCIISLSLWIISKKHRDNFIEASTSKTSSASNEGKKTNEKSPQKIDHEVIDPSEFQNCGPLVMQARMKGRIKHALDDDKSYSLKEIQFDPKYNEIVTIGSEIERLEGISQLSMLSGEKSAEVLKGMKNKAHSAKATGMEPYVDEATRLQKEAQRVAENERRIAECAARRRAKEEARKKSELSLDKSEEMKSEKTNSLEDKTFQKVHYPQRTPEIKHYRKDHERQTLRSEDTEMTKSQDEYRKMKFETNIYTSTKPVQKEPALSVGKAPYPVAVRRRPSNDGRRPDALGYKAVKYQIQRRAGSAPGSPRDDIGDDKDDSSKSQRTSSSSTYGALSYTRK